MPYNCILFQIVDARNPLLFRNADLEVAVKETDERNVNVLLVNKAELLTPDQVSVSIFMRELIIDL